MLSTPQSNSQCADRQHSSNCCGDLAARGEGRKHHHWAADAQSYCPSCWCPGFPWWEFKGSCPMQAPRWSCVCGMRSCCWPTLSESSAPSARTCSGCRSTKCFYPAPSTVIAEEGWRPGGRSQAWILSLTSRTIWQHLSLEVEVKAEPGPVSLSLFLSWEDAIRVDKHAPVTLVSHWLLQAGTGHSFQSKTQFLPFSLLPATRLITLLIDPYLQELFKISSLKVCTWCYQR